MENNEKRVKEVMTQEEFFGQVLGELAAIRCVCANLERKMLSHDSKYVYSDNTSVTECGLSARSENALVRNGITKVGQLRKVEDTELKELDGVGIKSYTEIRDFKCKCL